MNTTIKVLDKQFEVYISHEEVLKKIASMAEQMKGQLAEKKPLFLGILNGSFMFASDLFKSLDFDCTISFLKLASYSGTSSTGKIKRLIGLNEDIKNRTVVIIEDIVDSGITLDQIIKQLRGYEPAEIKICTLLFKPNAYKMGYKIDYCAFEIPNDFIVGYGLDYNGYGRNYKDIYKIK
jgi:hypoxanthine phosphoribosyltransferase